MKQLLQVAVLLAFCVVGTKAWAQPPAFNMTDTAVTECSGFFYDSGGPAGIPSGYQPNENYVFTICPTGTDLIFINFSQFNLDTGEVFNIYNGPTTASPLLGNYQWPNVLLGGVQATVQNPSGCLTFEFISDGSAEGSGWAAEWYCVDPCQPFQSTLVANSPAFNNTGYEIDICPGDTVTVSAAGVYPNNNFYYTQADAMHDFNWDMGDGTLLTGQTVSHQYDNPGQYGLLLDIIDTVGCDNANAIDIIVRVATEPTMSITAAQDTICYGETNQLTGSGNTNTYTQSWGNVLADSLVIPDNVGVPYQTTVTLNLFNPGQQLTNVADLLGICVNMEHSYLGDLNISIECPTGQTATLVSFPNGGGFTFLGEPVDFDGANPVPAVGYDYCWVPTVNGPQYGTFGATSNTFFYNYTDVTGQTYSNHPYLPAGSYTSEDPLTQLVGCELNGDWTITVVDNLGIDNGHIFSWYLDLDPSLFPSPLVSFTPGVVANNFQQNTTFLQFTDTTASVQPLVNGGDAEYVYILEDDFGCTWYDTVNFFVQSSNHPDCFVCYDPILQGTNISCNGAADGVIIATANDSLNISPPPYSFQWLGPTGAILRTANNIQSADTLDNIGPGTYTIIVTDANGCVSSSQITLVEPPPVFANIDSTRNVTCKGACDGFALLTVTGGQQPYQYHWSNNFHSLANAQLCAGTSDVTVTDANGCGPVLTVQLTEPDSVEITGFGDTTVCIGGTAYINATANGGTGGPYQYVWSNIGVPTSISSQYVSPQHPELYDVYAIDSAGCVSSGVKIAVQMFDALQLTVPPTDTLCPGQGSLIGVAVLGGNGDYYYQWSQGLGTDSAHYVTPDSTTTYNVTVTDGCSTPPAEEAVDVLVAQMPNTQYFTNLDTGCAPMTVNFFIDNHHPSNQYTWSFGDDVTVQTRSQSVPHLYPFPGCYDITLHTRTPEGCTELLHDICRIVVFPQPEADFSFSPLRPTNILSEVWFTDKSVGAVEWEYDMGTGDIIEDDPNFHYVFPDSGSYPVQLTIWNEGGCMDTITQRVEVAFEPSFYVPNAFTPDGDGLNDMFGPSGVGYQDKEYGMNIYNRWGELVYRTDDPSAMWDGRTRAGNYAPVGVYTWLITYRTVKGEDPEIVRGHVTLIR